MKHFLVLTAALALSGAAQAAELTVSLSAASAQGAGASLGNVRIAETPYGLVFHPQLTGLAPGLHGFHVHEKPSCDPAEKDGAPARGHARGRDAGRSAVAWPDPTCGGARS